MKNLKLFSYWSFLKYLNYLNYYNYQVNNFYYLKLFIIMTLYFFKSFVI